jgi:fructuronate reductase
MAAPDTQIVTLTITEKGYKLDPASGALIEDDPQLAADMLSLDRRRRLWAISWPLWPCGGRRGWGLLPRCPATICRIMVPGCAQVCWLWRGGMTGPGRVDRGGGAFPETMVDRIVPATTPDDIADLAARLGVEDRAMVKTEPFTQWVIEDRFCGPRPAFGAGVQLTAAVAPWEEAKLRLLNGAHSGIAYLGGLAGLAHVHEVLERPEARAFVEQLWDEAQTTLSPPPELDIAAYRKALMARFDNPTLMHRTHQIAMDGSQKLPQRLLAPIGAVRGGQGIEALSLAVAGWIRWQAGRDDTGQPFVVDDPLAAADGEASGRGGRCQARVDAVLGLEASCRLLAKSCPIPCHLIRWLTVLETQGALAALALCKDVSR